MRVIYVDDEEVLLENFRLTVKESHYVDDLKTFQKGADVLRWTAEHEVDAAFLDIEMPGENGISLARSLKELNRNIRIIFVTAYAQYALDAFGVDAVGYLLKIDGKPFPMGHTKQEELLAFLIDRGEAGVSGGDAIANLWSEKPSGESVYWTTMSRLKSLLEEAGIGFILGTKGKKKYIRTDQVDCDLYRMLAGDKNVILRYAGKYLYRYSWAEERNAQLNEIKRHAKL